MFNNDEHIYCSSFIYLNNIWLRTTRRYILINPHKSMIVVKLYPRLIFYRGLRGTRMIQSLERSCLYLQTMEWVVREVTWYSGKVYGVRGQNLGEPPEPVFRSWWARSQNQNQEPKSSQSELRVRARDSTKEAGKCREVRNKHLNFSPNRILWAGPRFWMLEWVGLVACDHRGLAVLISSSLQKEVCLYSWIIYTCQLSILRSR